MGKYGKGREKGNRNNLLWSYVLTCITWTYQNHPDWTENPCVPSSTLGPGTCFLRTCVLFHPVQTPLCPISDHEFLPHGSTAL